MGRLQNLSVLVFCLSITGCTLDGGDSIDDNGRDLDGDYTLFLTLEDAWDWGPALDMPDVYRFSVEPTDDGLEFSDEYGPLSVVADDAPGEGLHVYFDANLEFVKSEDDECGPVGQIQYAYSSFHLIFSGSALYGDVDATVSFEGAWPPQDPDPCLINMWHLFRATGQRE